MKVLLIHAYSSSNSGDGLLVEEALSLVEEAHPGSSVVLHALDPASFDRSTVEQVRSPLSGEPYDGGRKVSTLARIGASVVFPGLRPQALHDDVACADMIVAVGGGYLRAKFPLEAVKTFFAHVTQIPVDSGVAARTIYLPQSIGPLRFGSGSIVKARLGRVARVFVRDDRSADSVGGLRNVTRMPDMALLGMANVFSATSVSSRPSNRAGLVARALPGRQARHYEEQVRGLYERGDFELLTQAVGRGNDDVSFYRETLGQARAPRALAGAVHQSSESRPPAVVSVRLHGALESIRSGVPAIHLSYERKGWGAFDDLGISKYVHNAFDFDREAVLAQVDELREDASAYWKSVRASLPALARQRAEIVAALRAILPREGVPQ